MLKVTRTKSPPTLPPPFSFRVPRNGELDPFFGCARTCWYELILPTKANNFHPPVRSIRKVEPGAKRGIRLILYASAKAYFEALAANQEAV